MSRRGQNLRGIAAVALAIVYASGCGEEEVDGEQLPDWWGLPYASEVIEFEPGEGAGFGEEEFPDVVLGPPGGGSATSGSLDVLSLGAGGEIVVAFSGREIVNAEGPDFVVFENAFWPGGDPDEVWAELGEVSVSDDGENWKTFSCEYEAGEDPPYEGCAGWTPTFAFDVQQVVPIDAEVTGGDAFDLSEVGLERARYVRIRDVWGLGEAPSRGFDLDAVGLINYEGEAQ